MLENNPVLQAAKNRVKEQISIFKTLSDQRKISYRKQGVLGYGCAPLTSTSLAPEVASRLALLFTKILILLVIWGN